MSQLSGASPNSLPTISGGSSGSSTSNSSTQIVPGMMNVYSQLLGANENNYGNMMNAYQTGEQTIGQQSPQIAAGYGNVNSAVQNQLGMGQVLGQNGNWGVAGPAAQAIQQQTQQGGANITQQMTNAGLGNTTAAGNAQTQNTFYGNQALAGLGSQLAQTAAGYTAQEGNAAQASQMQGLGLQANLYGQALNPLSTQFSNTAGSLTGGVSSSSSTQKANPASQNGSNAQQAANNPANQLPNLAGQTGAASGGGGLVYSGGGGGGGGSPSGSNGYNPLTGGGGATGTSGGNGYSSGGNSLGAAALGGTGTVLGSGGGMNGTAGALGGVAGALGSQGGNAYDSQADLQKSQAAEMFGGSGFAPGVPTSPPNPGDGAIMASDGSIIGWSPWGVGGSSGPAVGG